MRAFLTHHVRILSKLKTIKEVISNNLSGTYNIIGKVINFKDFEFHLVEQER